MKHIIDTLWERGFIEQMTDDEGLRTTLAQPQKVYIGFDPTSDSLHIGSLVQIMVLSQLARHGHHPVILLGGATGMIGDPSGKSEERNLLTAEQIEHNVAGIAKQLRGIVARASEREESDAVVVNNIDWTENLSVIDWLRDIGKLFTVNYMVAKESVRRRFEDRDQGISYTEFSYMLVQAHDFLQLFEREGCLVQMGGSDQWGNITAGIELIRRKLGEQAYGLTTPLVTNAAGQKFGKTEAGAIYLDPDRTSVWDFYQYFVRVDDRDVVPYMKKFTFLEMDEIASYEGEVRERPEERAAQKRLAWEVTALIHGPSEARRMEKGAEALYAGRLEDLDRELIRAAFADSVGGTVSRARLQKGINAVDLFDETGLVKSKGEARRMIRQGALYVNNQRLEEGDDLLSETHVLPSGVVVLRRGKKEYRLLEVEA
ncbi:tyrosine--tRNA ligase [bacterium]|nr:tyrosine--tRNA ligase [bacterium]